MAFARVVAFEGVSAERMEKLRDEMTASPTPPADVPAKELLLLHDPAGGKSLAILFFENEADYEKGHATLDAMPSDETPGNRVSVDKFDVVARMTAP
jgi:hypothetical protein